MSLFDAGLYNENRSSEGFVAYATSIDPSDSGFDFPSYEEPPPPYSSMNKPCDDEPPPYEQITQDGLGSESDVLNNTTVDHEQVAEPGGETNVNRRSHPLGAFTYCVTPTDLGNARGRAVKFWLVAGTGDTRPKSAESIELQTLTSSSRQPTSCDSFDGRQNENIPVQMRPLRKKCGKCRHSADAAVGREWSRATKPGCSQAVSRTRPPDEAVSAVESINLESRTVDPSTSHVAGKETGAVSSTCGITEGLSLGRNRDLKADSYYGTGILEPWKTGGRKDDIMVRSAPAEAFTDCSSYKPKTKFKISSEHLCRSSHRPVSCDEADFTRSGTNGCRLHIEGPTVAVLSESMFSYEPECFRNFSHRCRPSAVRIPRDANGETSRLTSQSLCHEGRTLNNSSTISTCSDEIAGLHMWNCAKMNSPAVSERCGLAQVLGSDESISSICAETGEKKKTDVLLKPPGIRPEKAGAGIKQEASPVTASRSVWSSLGDCSSAVRTAYDDTLEPCVLPCASQPGLHDTVARKSVKRGLRRYDNESAGETACASSQGKDDHADDCCSDKAATYEYVIDRILEQIEAARLQFGWENPSLSTTGGRDGCHSNMLHKCNQPFRRTSASSCCIQNTSDADVSANVRHVLSDVPKLLADDGALLDVMNSNMNVSELSKLSTSRSDLSADVHGFA
jgi:hypothetical protein